MMWIAKTPATSELMFVDDLAVSKCRDRTVVLISAVIRSENIGMIKSNATITLSERSEATLEPKRLQWWSEDLSGGMSRICGVLKATGMGLPETLDDEEQGTLIVAPQADNLLDVAWNQTLRITKCPLKHEWGQVLAPTIRNHLKTVAVVEKRWFRAAWLTLTEEAINAAVSHELTRGALTI